MGRAVLSENTASEVVTDSDKERERPFVFLQKDCPMLSNVSWAWQWVVTGVHVPGHRVSLHGCWSEGPTERKEDSAVNCLSRFLLWLHSCPLAESWQTEENLLTGGNRHPGPQMSVIIEMQKGSWEDGLVKSLLCGHVDTGFSFWNSCTAECGHWHVQAQHTLRDRTWKLKGQGAWCLQWWTMEERPVSKEENQYPGLYSHLNIHRMWHTSPCSHTWTCLHSCTYIPWHACTTYTHKHNMVHTPILTYMNMPSLIHLSEHTHTYIHA